ncbi:MAG: putative exonuclease/polymerase [Candidatus Tokpelaia sp. JSC085]|nr:MAG: putative exonuclease/polymerase [Candidatus Tokpelaia sp. JSC085]
MIEKTILQKLSEELAHDVASMENDIYELAGEKINLSSPNQLGNILFGKLSLPGSAGRGANRSVVNFNEDFGRFFC